MLMILSLIFHSKFVLKFHIPDHWDLVEQEYFLNKLYRSADMLDISVFVLFSCCTFCISKKATNLSMEVLKLPTDS